MTTKPISFPQSRIDSTGTGPDFPGSSGDRERGRFRPSVTPRLTNVAVSGDDGQPVAFTLERLLTELLLWQKAAVVASILQAEGAHFSVDDLLNQASRM